MLSDFLHEVRPLVAFNLQHNVLLVMNDDSTFYSRKSAQFHGNIFYIVFLCERPFWYRLVRVRDCEVTGFEKDEDR